MRSEFGVIGVETIGSAVAYGLSGWDDAVTAVKDGDVDFRAMPANLGPVWVRPKGINARARQALSRTIAKLPADFNRGPSGLPKSEEWGGLAFYFAETAFDHRKAPLLKLHTQCCADNEDLGRCQAASRSFHFERSDVSKIA
jgi:hypothetical protein